MTASEEDDAAASLLRLIQLRDEANVLSRALVGETSVPFGELSLETPRLAPAELGFLRLVAWLYVSYRETGAVGIKFLKGLVSGYGVGSSESTDAHYELVSALRTYSHHNLDPGKPGDRATQTRCEEWFATACGSRRPDGEKDWSNCVRALLRQANGFFSALVAVIRAIEADEESHSVCEQWAFRVRRHHPPADFDPVIDQVAGDLGRDSLDTVRFRVRFYERWVRSLDMLDGEYDFEREARLLIEQALIVETSGVLPISGKDIMEEFAISPGPEVGSLLAKARTLFEERACGRDELLERLGLGRGLADQG